MKFSSHLLGVATLGVVLGRKTGVIMASLGVVLILEQSSSSSLWQPEPAPAPDVISSSDGLEPDCKKKVITYMHYTHNK